MIGRNDLARLMAPGLVNPVMSRQGDDSITDWMFGRGNAPVREPLTRDIFRQDRPALTHEPMEVTQDRAMQEYFRRLREQLDRNGWKPQVDPQWPKWPETVPRRLP